MAKSANRELLPAYLIVGDDALKREVAVRRLRARMDALGDAAFNTEDFDGEVAIGADIVAACNTVPFACEKRLVFVHNAEKLRKADSEELVAYLSAPCETTILALEAEKLAKNTRLHKAVAAVGSKAVIECALPKGRDELPRKVREMGPGHGITLTEGAARRLVELLGDDTVRIDSELRKLALAHEGAGPVDEREVGALVARATEPKPWELTDAFAGRDLARVLKTVSLMRSSSPHALLPQCVRRVRELICVQSLMRRGAGDQEMAQALGLSPARAWTLKNYKAWVRAWRAGELRRALATARDAEQHMKSGGIPEAVFKDWLVGTLAKTGGTASR